MIQTRTKGVTVLQAAPTLLLTKNPRRIMYSIQNLDAANYIAYSSNPNVAAAGTATANEGFHVTAGQVVSDDMDKDQVWAIANTANVIVTVTEITEVPMHTASLDLPDEERGMQRLSVRGPRVGARSTG